MQGAILIGILVGGVLQDVIRARLINENVRGKEIASTSVSPGHDLLVLNTQREVRDLPNGINRKLSSIQVGHSK